jgi:hypothetical protein
VDNKHPLTHDIEQLLQKTYDKYVPQDWRYDNDIGDLNPKREVEWDKPITQKVLERLQDISNQIVRSKLKPREAIEYPPSAIAGESLPAGMPLAQRSKLDAIGGGNRVFSGLGGGELDAAFTRGIGLIPGPFSSDEFDFIIGTMPPVSDLHELDLPLTFDCDDILTMYFGEDIDDDDDGRGDDAGDNKGNKGRYGPGALDGLYQDMPNDYPDEDANLYEWEVTGPDEGYWKLKDDSGDGGGDGGEDGGDGDDDGGDDEGPDDDYDDDGSDDDIPDDMKECATIELGWLKILLIIAKVIQILAKIIDFVLSIVMPIIAIIQLAVGAWLNPTNIAKIAQIILHMVIAIVVMIIGMIIQLIWDLLNLDCVAAATEALIAEIQKALSAFASIANAFNPTAVALLLDKVNNQVLDPLAKAASTLKNKADAYKDMGDKVKNTFKDLADPEKRKEMLKSMTEKAGQIVKGAVLSNPNVGRAMDIAKQTQRLLLSDNGPLGAAKNAIAAWKDFTAAQSAIKKSAGNIGNTAAKMTNSIQMTIDTFKG